MHQCNHPPVHPDMPPFHNPLALALVVAVFRAVHKCGQQMVVACMPLEPKKIETSLTNTLIQEEKKAINQTRTCTLTITVINSATNGHEGFLYNAINSRHGKFILRKSHKFSNEEWLKKCVIVMNSYPDLAFLHLATKGSYRGTPL